jgi:hypothetical protein
MCVLVAHRVIGFCNFISYFLNFAHYGRIGALDVCGKERI